MPVEKITSVQNRGVKYVSRLRTKKSREAKGLTIVEGVREVTQAFRAGWRFSCVYMCQDGEYRCPQELIDEIEAKRVKVFDTSYSVFSKIAYGDRTEGILALVEHPARELKGLKLSQTPLIVVLESVEKPGNLGAVLRTCDGAKVDALLVCDEQCDIHNPNVVRSSLGAIFTVPTVTCSNKDALEFLKTNGIRSFAAVVQAQEDYFLKDLSAPAAIVLGSEKDGLSAFWQQNADEQVRIPMNGAIDSLNVSVSAAVMVYEAVRQRKTEGVNAR